MKRWCVVTTKKKIKKKLIVENICNERQLERSVAKDSGGHKFCMVRYSLYVHLIVIYIMMTVIHLSSLVCQRYVKQSAMVWKRATINAYSRDLNKFYLWRTTSYNVKLYIMLLMNMNIQPKHILFSIFILFLSLLKTNLWCVFCLNIN